MTFLSFSLCQGYDPVLDMILSFVLHNMINPNRLWKGIRHHSQELSMQNTSQTLGRISKAWVRGEMWFFTVTPSPCVNSLSHWKVRRAAAEMLEVKTIVVTSKQRCRHPSLITPTCVTFEVLWSMMETSALEVLFKLLWSCLLPVLVNMAKSWPYIWIKPCQVIYGERLIKYQCKGGPEIIFAILIYQNKDIKCQSIYVNVNKPNDWDLLNVHIIHRNCKCWKMGNHE